MLAKTTLKKGDVLPTNRTRICWIHSAHTTKCLDGYNKMFCCSDKQIQQTHVSQSVEENAVDVLGAGPD